ncbi:MAG: GNAT family N-acetyltransferase [Candidatus Thorarchaeota archaeon]|jgi:RimJ/RimL family protein N-acetyltransferase
MILDNFENARTLFKGFDYQVVVRAVIEGSSPGKIWVNDATQPSSGFMATTEGWFLAGDPSNDGFNQGLKDLVHDMILKRTFYSPMNTEFLNYLFFHIDSDNWKTEFPNIFSIRPPLPTHRIHFTCTRVILDWQNGIPEGYRLLQVDSTFDADSLEFPDDIEERVKHQLKDQMARGFGKCLVHGSKVVVWIHSDCASGEDCEIGIITTEEYRLKGLGALTAAATVDHCLSIGFSNIGWHCEDHNYGSIGVAEKVGFIKERAYVHYICMFDEAEHLVEKGMRHFYDKEYEDAIVEFERAFSTGEVPVWSYLLAARSYATMNDLEPVIKHLKNAHDLGWENWEPVFNSEELLLVQDNREFKEFKERAQ